MKKLLSVFLALLLMFSFAACSINYKLPGYKFDAGSDLTLYAERTDYSQEDWARIEQIILDAKSKINGAKSKGEVDAALEEAKRQIDDIQKKKNQAPVEVETDGMVQASSFSYLDSRSFIGDPIFLNHPEGDAVFLCSIDKGSFDYYQQESTKSVTPGGGIYWIPYRMRPDGKIISTVEGDKAHIRVVLRINGNIIGYAVVELYPGDEIGMSFFARNLHSALFPKIDGEYQNITKEYVESCIDKIIEENLDEPADEEPNPQENLNEWTNDNAVYVQVKSEYMDDVLTDANQAFAMFDLKAVYIVGKWNLNSKSLSLLLVLKNGEEQASSIEKLRADTRIEYAYACDDVPFENINTLCLVPSSDTLEVGDTITVSVEDEYRIYRPNFEFDKITVSLTDNDPNKIYTSADFPQAEVVSVEISYVLSNKTFYTLTLAKTGYFEVIKAVNAFALDSAIATARLNYIYDIEEDVVRSPSLFPVWYIFDPDIAQIENNDIITVQIRGLKPGKTTVIYASANNTGVSCEITVENTAFPSAVEADLIEKYALTFKAYTWNDYMPGVDTSKSNSYVDVNTDLGFEDVEPNPRDLLYSSMSMLVKIVTASKSFRVEYLNGGGSGFRPVTDFRLDDREEYTMYITIAINGEKQTVILTGTVAVTH